MGTQHGDRMMDIRQSDLQPLGMPHAAARWAQAVVGAVPASEDPRTLKAWGHHLGMSPSRIRAYCRLAGFSAKDSLDFARMLRAVVHHRQSGWPIEDLLDYGDARTLRRLQGRADLDEPSGTLTPEQYVARQSFIRNEVALREVLRRLQRIDHDANGR